MSVILRRLKTGKDWEFRVFIELHNASFPWFFFSFSQEQGSLDWASPVVNRHSTNKLHQFAKKNDTRHLTTDMWHLKRDRWQVIHDTWHLTCDMWCGVNILSTCQLPSFYRLGVMMFWRSGGKRVTEWINQKQRCL